jgi:tetratricopeptide (TPR) repeat protein
MRVRAVLPALLICIPSLAQFNDVVENARQRDRPGVDIFFGQRDPAAPDAQVPRADYHPDFPKENDPELARTRGAKAVSRTRLAHKPPKRARKEFDGGVRARGQGRTVEAIQRFREAVRLDDEYIEAHMHLGELLLRSGAAAEALKHMERARAIDGSPALLHANIALALLQLKRPIEAEDSARRAVQLAPASEPAHLAVALALIYEDQITSETAEHLRVAAAKYPAVRDLLVRVRERLSLSTIPR